MDLFKFDVIISEDALSMLDLHARFLAKVNQNAAKKLVDQVLDDISSLSTLPERCPYYTNPFVPCNRYRMMISNKRYLIIYEVSGETVYVDYVIDSRRNNKMLFS